MLVFKIASVGRRGASSPNDIFVLCNVRCRDIGHFITYTMSNNQASPRFLRDFFDGNAHFRILSNARNMSGDGSAGRCSDARAVLLQRGTMRNEAEQSVLYMCRCFLVCSKFFFGCYRCKKTFGKSRKEKGKSRKESVSHCTEMQGKCTAELSIVEECRDLTFLRMFLILSKFFLICSKSFFLSSISLFCKFRLLFVFVFFERRKIGCGAILVDERQGKTWAAAFVLSVETKFEGTF